MNTKELKLAVWNAVFALSEADASNLLADACKIIGLPLSTHEKHLYLAYKDLVKTGRSVHGPRNLAQNIARWQGGSCYPGINVNGKNYPDVWLALAFFAATPPVPALTADQGVYDQDKQDRMYRFLQDALGLNDQPVAETPVVATRSRVQIDPVKVPKAETVWNMDGIARNAFRVNLFNRIPADQADQILLDACEGTTVNVNYDPSVGAYCTIDDLQRANLPVRGPRDYYNKAKIECLQSMLPDGTVYYSAPIMLAYLTRTTFRGSSPEDSRTFSTIRNRIATALNIDPRVFHRLGTISKALEARKTKLEAPKTPKVVEAVPFNPANEILMGNQMPSKLQPPPPIEAGSWDNARTAIRERMGFLLEQRRIAEENGIPWNFVIQGIL